MSGHTFITATRDEAKESLECMMLCTPVDDSLVERSAVLQGLREAGRKAHGIVSGLPEGIRGDEFSLWASNDPSGRQIQDLSWSSLGSILKVADALADSKLSSWVQVLAERIHGVDWKGQDSDTITSQILSFPPRLLHAAMCKLREQHLPENGGAAMCKYIQKLPVALDGALLSSLIQTGGQLAISFPVLTPLLLASLMRSQLCGPEVLSLELNCPTDVSRASLLSSCIASHTALTKLALHWRTVEQWGQSELVSVCRSVPTNLRELHILDTFKDIALADFGRVLWQLPALENLCMGQIQLHDTIPDVPTPQAVAAGNYFVEALAARPALTSLKIGSTGFSCSQSRLSDTAFIKLKQLELRVPPFQYQKHDFLAAMRQVTKLVVHTNIKLMPNARERGQPPKSKPWSFLEDIGQLTAIKSLDLTAATLSPNSSDVQACTAALQHCLSSMPSLQHLEATVTSSKLPCAFADCDLGSCCSALTALELTLPVHLSVASGAVLHSVSCMHGLRSLTMRMGEEEGIGDSSAVSALPLPPHLNEMTFTLSVGCEVLGSALSRLVSLRCLDVGLDGFDNMQAFCSSVSRLSALRTLCMRNAFTDSAAVTESDCEVLASTVCCMPRLQQLSLRVLLEPGMLHGLFGAMTSLEALGILEVTLGRLENENTVVNSACQHLNCVLDGVKVGKNENHKRLRFRMVKCLT